METGKVWRDRLEEPPIISKEEFDKARAYVSSNPDIADYMHDEKKGDLYFDGLSLMDFDTYEAYVQIQKDSAIRVYSIG